MIGIIGGSGFEKFDGFQNLEEISRETPFGEASSGVRRVRVAGKECLFISRHGAKHELTPSEINYRANIYLLKKMGVTSVISFSAVGSLQAECAPGDLVVPFQYIDRTKGVRKHTYCGDGVVGHVSLAHPVCRSAAEGLQGLVKSMAFRSHFGKTYVCIEGPQFSTLAESLSYRALNADIIGMTNFPEYALAREAGLSYLPCCFVTDYDCWDTSRPHVTLEEVIRIMRENNGKAFEILQAVVQKGESLWQGCSCANDGLKMGLMTPREHLPPAFDVLL